MKLDLTTVNEILTKTRTISLRYDCKDFYNLPKDWKNISITTDENFGRESQGDEGECVCIFQVKNLEDVFVKIIFTTDSYGEESKEKYVQFVEQKEKTVTVYESI